MTRTPTDEPDSPDAARDEWARRAQHAISLAATRADGLAAAIAELAGRLGSWVGLFDASGGVMHSAPAWGSGPRSAAAVACGVRRLLAGRRPGSLTIDSGTGAYLLQALPGAGRLHGVLAVAAAGPQDRAEREVVTSVIALASLALQQSHELEDARRALRAGLLTLVSLGEVKVVEATTRNFSGPLPTAPVRVAALDAAPAQAHEICELLEPAARSGETRLFFAYDDELVVCAAADEAAAVVAGLVRDHGLHAGLSDPADWPDFAVARAQATRALELAADGPPRVVDFDQLARSGVLAFLARAGVAEIATATLAPLRAHDAAHGTELFASVRCWLEHDCEYDRAARRLGVHRHTVRARMDLAADLLDRDLSALSVRADLWAAYLATAS